MCVSIPLLGKASVTEVKIKAFGAAMAHAGHVLCEAIIASHSNVNALIDNSTSCRGLCSLLFSAVRRSLSRACASSSKLARFGLCNELCIMLGAFLRYPLAVNTSHKLVPSSVAGTAKVT